MRARGGMVSMFKMQPLTPFIELIAKAHRISRIVGGCIAAFGGALYFIPAKSDKDTMIKLGIMALFIVLGLFIAGSGFRDPDKHKAIVTLRQSPQDIVWVFVQRNLRNGQHLGSQLNLGHISGQMLQLPLVIGQEDALRSLVLARVPHAHVGFDPEVEARFKQSPASLKG